MFIAADPDAFRDLFVRRLQRLLGLEQAGGFILVLANSLQDNSLQRLLQQDIEKHFDRLAQRYRDGRLDAAADDLAVYSALCNSGIGSLQTWATRAAGCWELNCNPIRALRPARFSHETVASIKREFDPGSFNFNKPFLQPEILWEGRWRAVPLRVMYNKFPFAPWHLIIVPEPDRLLPQFLDRRQHALVFELVTEVRHRLPGFAAAFNSLGACASVNQLHFQSLVRAEPLPVESPRWRHNGGSDAYPVACSRLESVDGSWSMLQRLHAENRPYNLFYRPGCCYVLERRMQGSEGVEALVQGAGWIELCGVFNIADRSRFEALGAEELERCLESLST